MDDLYQIQGYANFVAEFNRVFGTQWDGYIWDFQLVRAIASALKNEAFNGIEIVASFYIVNGDHGNYQDPVTAQEIVDMVSLFAGRDVSSKIAYKRISSSGSVGSHSKLAVIDDDQVDGALLYVGSENAYASYNQEFGAWVEDGPSIRAFLSDYWARLWAKAIMVWPPGQKINTIDETKQTPAACVFKDQLYVFWTADDGSNRIYFSASNGPSWKGIDSSKTRLTPAVPGLPCPDSRRCPQTVVLVTHHGWYASCARAALIPR